MVAIGTIVLMIYLMLVITGVAVCDCRDSDAGRARILADRAFYAADAGIQMAVREIMEDADEDGDGVIGGISHDSNSANNPRFNGADVDVAHDAVSGQISLSASS